MFTNFADASWNGSNLSTVVEDFCILTANVLGDQDADVHARMNFWSGPWNCVINLQVGMKVVALPELRALLLLRRRMLVIWSEPLQCLTKEELHIAYIQITCSL